LKQLRRIYESRFTVFLQIVQHVEDWLEKPDWARIEFVNAGIQAKEALASLKINADFLKPIVSFVQTHLQTLITDFQGIIYQALAAAKQSSNQIQSLIGTGNLLQS